jgi:hypothetical protein
MRCVCLAGQQVNQLRADYNQAWPLKKILVLIGLVRGRGNVQISEILIIVIIFLQLKRKCKLNTEANKLYFSLLFNSTSISLTVFCKEVLEAD